MSVAVKPGEHHIFDPTNISFGNKTILQSAFLRLFPKTNKSQLEILKASPGDEIVIFHKVLVENSMSGIILRDDRGVSVQLKADDVNPISPPNDLVTAIVRSLAIAYEEASRRNPLLKRAILSLDKHIYFIQNTGSSLLSFIYDGYKKSDTGKIVRVKDNNNVLNKALTRAKDAIVAQESIGINVLTPAEIQNDLIESYIDKLKLDVIQDKDDWKFKLKAPVPLQKLYPVAFSLNRGFLKATHSSMLLPDDAPYQIVKHTENIGKKISRALAPGIISEGEIVSSVEIRDYASKLETDIIKGKNITLVPSANGYEMKSMFAFDKFRPILNPVL